MAYCYRFLLFFTLFPLHLTAQDWNLLEKKIPTPYSSTGQRFGEALAVDNGIAIAGAPYSNTEALYAGKAVILEQVGDTWVPIHELYSGLNYERIFFGNAVDIEGELAVVGAPGGYMGSHNEGHAIVYRKGDTWAAPEQLAVLSPDDLSAFSLFGTSVAIHGDVIAIGAPYANGTTGSSGAVYIYQVEGDNVVFKQKITHANSLAGGNFGDKIAFNNTNMFVSNPSSEYAATPKSFVAVYSLPDFQLVADLTSSSSVYVNFGVSLAASNDAVAVGTYSEDNVNGSSGAVYVFNKNSGWVTKTEDVKFVPLDDTNEIPYYGLDIALTGDRLVINGEVATKAETIQAKSATWTTDVTRSYISAPANETFRGEVAINGEQILLGKSSVAKPGISSGVIGVYEADGDVWEAVYDINNIALSTEPDRFGCAVDIEGNYAIIGAYASKGNGSYSGYAYVYERQGASWNLVARLSPSDAGSDEYFGYAVAINENRAVVSAFSADNISYEASGKVYVFEKPASGWAEMTETSVITRPVEKRGFGHALALSNDEVVVTAYRNSGTDDIGYAYLFKKASEDWNLSATLEPSLRDVATADGFGYSVAFHNTTVVIGAPFSQGRNGSVLLFEKPAAGWSDMTNSAVLTPESDYNTFTYFGSDVDITDEAVVVSGPNVTHESNKGAAFVYLKGAGWTSRTEDAILSVSSDIGIELAHDVAIDGDYVAVTARGNSDVLFFRRNGDEFSFVRNELTGLTSDIWSVSIDSDDAVVGFGNEPASNGVLAGAAVFLLKNPTVTVVSSPSEDKTYGVTMLFTIDVEFSQDVVVSGSPTLALALDDETTVDATYLSSTGSTMKFQYTVQEGHVAADLNYFSSASLSDGSITSAINGVEADATLPEPLSSLSLGATKNIVINGIIDGVDPNVEDAFVLYPNPAKSRITIEGEQIIAVTIFDSCGRSVLERTEVEGDMSVEALPAGVYFVTVQSRSRSQVVRLVKL